MSSQAVETRAARGMLRGSHPRQFERVFEALLLACAALSVLTTAGILLVLLAHTIGFFRVVSLAQFLFDTRWSPLFVDAHFGIWPLVTGTLLTSGIAMTVAVPFGLLAAVFLSELASPSARRVLKPLLELLAGVPAVALGYVALVFVTPLLQGVVPGLSGFNALAPGIVIGIMIIPVVASLSEDALRAVPRGLREASYGLGATRLSTLVNVVLPAASSGVAASIILALARAFGETMIVAIAAGHMPRLTLDPRVPIETMTAYIVQISQGDVPRDTLEYHTLFAVGATLFLLTLCMNVLSLRLARRLRRGA